MEYAASIARPRLVGTAEHDGLGFGNPGSYRPATRARGHSINHMRQFLRPTCAEAGFRPAQQNRFRRMRGQKQTSQE